MCVKHDQSRLDRAVWLDDLAVVVIPDAEPWTIDYCNDEQGCAYGNSSRHVRCQSERVNFVFERVRHGKCDGYDASSLGGQRFSVRFHVRAARDGFHSGVGNERWNSCFRGQRRIYADGTEWQHDNAERYDGDKRRGHMELQAECEISGGNVLGERSSGAEFWFRREKDQY
jgi:hypothetical protein